MHTSMELVWIILFAVPTYTTYEQLGLPKRKQFANRTQLFLYKIVVTLKYLKASLCIRLLRSHVTLHSVSFTLPQIKDVYFFFKWTDPGLFVYFCSYQQQFYCKILDYSENRTRIVGVEGKYANHLTTTTTPQAVNFCLNPLCSELKSFRYFFTEPELFSTIFSALVLSSSAWCSIVYNQCLIWALHI